MYEKQTAVEWQAEEQSEILGWGKFQGLSEQNGFKDAYINGYNKAKETMYTEEQVREAMEFARGYHKMTDTQFIETIKNNL